MGVYVITNGEGSYIRRDETSGKYVPIRSLSKAIQWDSITKANGILNNSIAKNIRSGYAVQLIDTDKTVEKGEYIVGEQYNSEYYCFPCPTCGKTVYSRK